jgi:hypothetical protein
MAVHLSALNRHTSHESWPRSQQTRFAAIWSPISLAPSRVRETRKAPHGNCTTNTSSNLTTVSSFLARTTLYVQATRALSGLFFSTTERASSGVVHRHPTALTRLTPLPEDPHLALTRGTTSRRARPRTCSPTLGTVGLHRVHDHLARSLGKSYKPERHRDTVRVG